MELGIIQMKRMQDGCPRRATGIESGLMEVCKSKEEPSGQTGARQRAGMSAQAPGDSAGGGRGRGDLALVRGGARRRRTRARRPRVGQGRSTPAEDVGAATSRRSGAEHVGGGRMID